VEDVSVFVLIVDPEGWLAGV